MSEWQPIATAPRNATWIIVKLSSGKIHKAHWAEDLSGEEQPPFRGWFIEAGKNSFIGISGPTEWMPLANGEELLPRAEA